MSAEAEIRIALLYSCRFIRLSASGGRFTLEGSVEWDYQRSRAEDAVRRVAGAAGVRNLISIEPRVDAAEVLRRLEAAPREASDRVRSWAEPRTRSAERAR
jgi:osmotically-inducible protein OsmY